jgi:hypothetical protein
LFPVQKDLDLGSVLILAPMGSSVHAGLKDELKKHFPNMMNVSKEIKTFISLARNSLYRGKGMGLHLQLSTNFVV